MDNNRNIAQVLHEIAEDEVPATLDMWPAIKGRLGPRRPAPRWTMVTRLSWASLILVALLLLGGVAYALSPALGQVFRAFFPGWRHVEEAHLAQDISLSQTIDGVTVTLERVYADANEIIIGYTVKGATGPVQVSRTTLTDEQGRVFPEMAGAGVMGSSALLGVNLPPGEGAYVTAFDASPVEGAPAALRLHLTMHLVRLVPAEEDASTVIPPQPTDTTLLVPVQTMREEVVGGPFTFDFSVPFIPGQTIEADQIIEEAGVAIRLEQVVIAPSETRAIVCFAPPAGADHWTLLATLTTGDGHQVSASNVSPLDGVGEERCQRVSFPEPLHNRPGLWTLEVTELIGTDLTQIPTRDVRLSGPWTFRFSVP
ncbi:MAG: DUF4179 domain-containing protein [Anaerolineae bacterium]|nr:DUF4179 domain-containing protein [Anaerolineae bacterium]